MIEEDARLMLRVREDDPAAFETLFQRWRRPIVRFAVRFVGQQERGEELAQEIFLKIYRARHRYEAREAFRAYIFRVASNHCLNELRRGEYRHKRVAVEELSREPIDFHRPSPEALLQADHIQQTVRRAVAALPPQQRAALLLQREEGLPQREIAEIMETTVSAVKSLLTRARKALMVELAPLLKDDTAQEGALR